MQETPAIPWQTLKTKTHQKPPVQEILEEYARSFTEVYEAQITAYVTGRFVYSVNDETRRFIYSFQVVNRYKGNKTITLFEINLESPSANLGVFSTDFPEISKTAWFNNVEEMKNKINDNIVNNPDWENAIFLLSTSEAKPEDDLPF